MTHADDPQTIADIAQIRADIQEIKTRTGARYNTLDERLTTLEANVDRRMTALETRVTTAVEDIQRRADEIHHDTHYARLMARKLFELIYPELVAEKPSRPDRDTPRPMVIDRACAANPSEGEQRVDLPQYGLVIHVTPGDDPRTIWEGVLDSLNEE